MRLSRTSIIILILITVNILTFMAYLEARGNNAVTYAQDSKARKFPLLAKRIFVEDPNDVLINFTSLRTQIRNKFETIQEPHSFYFEYLPTGTTIRRDGENQLVAASLVKLPLIMNLYHASELERLGLDDTITITEDDLDPSFGSLYEKGAGTKMTLRELAKLGLTESDNTATRAINRTLEGKLRGNDESLPWLDVDYSITDGEAVVSAREYSSVLKCLHFSCYLKPESSQEILRHMTESKFSDRLTKYVPKTVQVAHKIGVFNPQDVHSDCGIFYVPQRPYLMCIMLEGDEAVASERMADISRDVYGWVSSR